MAEQFPCIKSFLRTLKGYPDGVIAAAAIAATARIEDLEAALEPFAATGAVIEPKPKDDACWAGQQPAPPITFGHLRAAARAVASKVPETVVK